MYSSTPDLQVSLQRSPCSTCARSHWIRAHVPGHPGGQFLSKSFCLYYLNCKKFGQLTIRKILEIVATMMSDFKDTVRQIRFRLGLCPRPRWGSLQRSPDPL